MARLTYDLLEHQAQVITSEKKITFLGAGVGAGKTDIGTIWLLSRLAESPEDVLHLVTANTYPQLYDSTVRNLLRNLKRFNVPHFPDDIPRAYAPRNMRIFLNGIWHEVLLRSLENYKGLSGIELGDAWLDEVWQTKEEAIDLVMARCRDTRVPNRLLYTTTLDDPSTWMYDKVVTNFDPDVMRVIYATTMDNIHLPDGYAEDMKKVYSERLYRRMVMAQWVSLETGQIYHSFDRKLHLDETVELDPHTRLWWTHDFNVGQDKPMSSVLLQERKGKSPEGEVRMEVHCIDEIVIDSSDTNAAIEEMEERDWIEMVGGKEQVGICGDASGKSKDSRSKTTDYKLLADAGFTHQEVPKKNPPLRNSHNDMNAMLQTAEGDVRIKIHPRCKTLLKGLETVKLRGGANYLEEETREQHVTTALRYFITKRHGIKTKRITTSKMTW